MSGKIILPPTFLEDDSPLIYLAGPIDGAESWHEKAINLIRSNAPELNVVSPKEKADSNTVDVYSSHLSWDNFHIRKAADNGVIVFWLAKQKDDHIGPYAQTTRFKLGEFKIRHERDGIKLVVGIEDGFSNAWYIRKRISEECPGIPICSNLEETCLTAIRMTTIMR